MATGLFNVQLFSINASLNCIPNPALLNGSSIILMLIHLKQGCARFLQTGQFHGCGRLRSKLRLFGANIGVKLCIVCETDRHKISFFWRSTFYIASFAISVAKQT